MFQFPSGDVRKHPNGVNMTRVVDKEHSHDPNSYQETVVDTATGMETRRVSERLADHVSERDKRSK